MRWMRRSMPLFLLAMLALSAPGCGNPVKRPPAIVYPGSKDYSDRMATFKITPEEAYTIAHEAARGENRLQFLSRRPTVLSKRWYVFGMPLSSGANLMGYHVNGDTGEVKFFKEDKVVPHSKR